MSRELLKEAAQALETVQHYFPAQDEADKGLAVADVDACQRLMTKIEAYLAAPSDSATGEKWGPSTIDKIRQRNADGDFTLDYWRATELIESYGRRVPRAMLEDLALEVANIFEPFIKTSDREQIDKIIARIAAKYGVEVEG